MKFKDWIAEGQAVADGQEHLLKASEAGALDALAKLREPKQPLKFDTGKTRLELLPPEFLTGIGKVLTFGAAKYAAGNWASGDGFDWSRLYGALLRHLLAWANGEDIDPESGLSHLYHAGCMLAFLCAHMERGLGKDDRKEIGVKP